MPFVALCARLMLSRKRGPAAKPNTPVLWCAGLTCPMETSGTDHGFLAKDAGFTRTTWLRAQDKNEKSGPIYLLA